jgi:Tfp pilus assembly protein PilX
MSLYRLKNSLQKGNQSGASMVIALIVLAIMLGFVALVLSRTVAETIITSNDTAESRTFNAAEAALEDATRDFATVVENKFVPPQSDINTIQTKAVPYFSANGYTFDKKITSLGASQTVTQTKGQFQGLVSLRDQWQIDVTATDNATGVQTQVRRRFFNDRIPIFQFGAFYQDDIEFATPPLFIFNGRIHTNGNLFVNTLTSNSSSDIRFKSKITIGGELVRDRKKTAAPLPASEQGDNVYAQNTTNTDTQLPFSGGSVTCGSGTGGGILTDAAFNGRGVKYFPYPNCSTNSNWANLSKNFENNVVTHAKLLNLPIFKVNQPLIEMLRRGKNVGDKANIGGTITSVTAGGEDNGVMSRERFANKEGIRISLADSKDKLPQCAGVITACGVQLDGSLGASLGYQPLAMTDGYTATAVNGNRLAVSGRQVWIKVELVNFDYNNQKPVTTDVTQDFLSLGVTEPIIKSGTPNNLEVQGYTSSNDSRSIIKLQRFAVEGNAIGNPTSTSYITNQTISSKPYNFVVRLQNVPSVNNGGLGGCPLFSNPCTGKDSFATPIVSGTVSSDETAHYKLASFDGGVSNPGNGKTRVAIVPFPIQLFDTREGNRADSTSGLNNNYVYKNGVMSVVDIDVRNLERFFNGVWDGTFPVTTPFALANGARGLKSTDVPSNRGWVVYLSDRRGDYDFDGRYNMEDVNPNSGSLLDEDLNGNGFIDTDYINEAPAQDSTVEAGMSAVTDHKYNRRAARLINGASLPGNYDPVTPSNTKGFTFASENGVYVLGNYNTTGVSVAGGTNVTTADRYSPLNTSTSYSPAAIMSDAVTVLSNNYNDGESFAYPNDPYSRPAVDTQVRFAMIAGDPLTASRPSPSSQYDGQNGGLNNFKRFMEDWTNKRMNYSGSLVNVFNSFNNNGRWKCCNTVYHPPIRDWTFEDSFTDPYRLPPGTPFVYFITFTGFERVND